MLLWRLQQAGGIQTSIRLVSCHLHRNLVVDFDVLWRRDNKLVQVRVGSLPHAAPCFVAPAPQVCNHVVVVLCCAVLCRCVCRRMASVDALRYAA